MTAHAKTREIVVQELNSDQLHGLSQEQAAEKYALYGENKLREKKKKTNLQRFLRSLRTS